MLNFFGLCSGQKTQKIKAGEIGHEVFAANYLKKREIHQLFASNPNQEEPKKESIKSIIGKDERLNPIQSFTHNSNKLTQTSGDQYTFVRTVMKSNYDQLRQKLIQKKQEFTDVQFPPDKSSLENDPKLQKAVNKWVRIRDIYKNAVFFDNETSPKDAIQGYFYGSGNCYFISAISNLARNPQRIKQIFGSIQVSKQGIYYAKLFNKGVYKQVIVDDFIPVSVAGTPLFSRPAQVSSEIWVMILQKCYAKLFGSYNSMNGGLPSQAYYALTGAPTFFYNLMDAKQLMPNYWEILVNSFRKNYCVDFGTSSNTDQTKWLKPNHAYTMLGAYEIQKIKLVKMRNPMGRFEWVGRCSDYDLPFWESITEKNKQFIGYEKNKQNDGIFFMLWQDVPTYFALFQVCEYKDNANLLSIRSKFTMKNANIYEVQLQSRGEVIFSLVQDSQRGTKTDLRTFKYSKSYFVISKLNLNSKSEQNFKIIKLAAKNQFAAHHQRISLEAGTYIVYSKYQWADDTDKQASFIVYSDTGLKIRQAKQSQYPQFLQKTFMSLPKQSPQFNDPVSSFTYVKKFYGQSGGYGFYAIKVKQSIKQRIQVQIDEAALKEIHIILKRPYRNKGKFKIILKESEQLIVVFRSKDAIIPPNITIPDAKINILST